MNLLSIIPNQIINNFKKEEIVIGVEWLMSSISMRSLEKQNPLQRLKRVDRDIVSWTMFYEIILFLAFRISVLSSKNLPSYNLCNNGITPHLSHSPNCNDYHF